LLKPSPLFLVFALGVVGHPRLGRAASTPDGVVDLERDLGVICRGLALAPHVVLASTPCLLMRPDAVTIGGERQFFAIVETRARPPRPRPPGTSACRPLPRNDDDDGLPF
jgi:hypothetical protein